MPLNVADPGYSSFEKLVLPLIIERGQKVARPHTEEWERNTEREGRTVTGIQYG